MHTSLLFPPESRTIENLVLSGACSYVPWLLYGLNFAPGFLILWYQAREGGGAGGTAIYKITKVHAHAC